MKQFRLVLSALLPIVAAGIQWVLWEGYIKPYVWFLFFPTAFFCASIGGLRGGLLGTVVSAVLVLYVFMPPYFSFALTQASAVSSIVLFVVMGALFSWFFDRLHRSMQSTSDALRAMEGANAKINTLYEKTRELDKLKSELFANISHELRTPLTLIMAPLEQRLRAGKGSDSSDDARRETEMMLRNARLLYRHVSDLLDTARLEAGRLRVEWANLDAAQLVRLVVSHFERAAEDRGIDLHIDAPAQLPIQGDAEKLQRMLMNLLSNAFKFTPENGGIVVRLRPDGDRYRVEIQDNGPGIPTDMREAVFERFRQVQGDDRRAKGGTGLGLAIVREFAELHGGKVSVSETPGGGAFFTLVLPTHAPPGTELGTPTLLDGNVVKQAQDEAVALRRASVEIPDVDQRPLILVVDDNLDMLSFLVACLRPHFRVASAPGSHEGLALARKLHPDLVLSDMMMPNMTGEELASEIRRTPGLEDVPIVILTAKADDNLKVRMLEAGAHDFLYKPFSVDELLARIRTHLTDRRRTDDRVSAIFEHSAVAMALVATDGRLLRVNRPFGALFGFTQPELVQTTVRALTHPDDVATDAEMMQRLLRGETENYTVEKRYLRKDGTTVWGNLTVALVRKETGEPDYLIKVIDDISPMKEMANKLTLAKIAAEHANRTKSDFLANMSHEIRTPMNAVIGLTHLLLDTTLEPAQRNYLLRLDSSARSLLGILNDILDYAKIEAGKLDLESVEFELADVLETTAGLFGVAAEDKQLELIFDVDPHLPPVLVGDPLRFKQILNNVVGNAIKFTTKGHVQLSVRALDRGESDLTLEVSVADTGVGIAPDRVERLFHAFEQGDSSTTRRFGGTGLGLVISKTLVEMMGGRIWVRSEQGCGSIFTFTTRLKLPAAPTVRHTAPPLRGMRTLVVDEQEITREALRRLLVAWMFEVEGATSGESGLRKALAALEEGNPYELVLVAGRLLDLDGIELARRLRQKEAQLGAANPHAIVLMVTSYGRSRAQDAAQSVKLDAILEKPVVQSQLLDVVATLQSGGTAARSVESRSEIQQARELVRGLRSATLLVAEDNATTQLVARDMLENLGFRVTVASNGREAVDRAGVQHFDAILMDLQMPEMGGIEATAHIRTLPKCERTPIIAMTAAAQASDRAACRAAGMNDFLAKPIDISTLAAVLLKWVPEQRQEQAPAQGLASSGPGTSFDVPGLSIPEALRRMGGDWRLLRRAISGFARDFGHSAIELDRMLQDRRWAEASRMVHTIKGLAKSIGADVLSANARDLETELTNERHPSLHQFKEQLSRTLADIQSSRIDEQDVMARPDADRIDALLQEIDGKLARSLFVSPDLVGELLRGLDNDVEQALCIQLRSQVEIFDYKGAHVALKALCDHRGLAAAS